MALRVGKLAGSIVAALMLGLTACQPVRPVQGNGVAPVVVGAMQQASMVDAVEAPTGPTVEPTPESTVEPTPEPTAKATVAPTPDPASMAAGLAVYRAQYCGVCHTLAAAGTTGTFGPEHNSLGATAAARIVAEGYSGAATTPAEYIYESIVAPELYIVPDYMMTSHRMPPYGHLLATDLAALVVFLAAQ